MDWLHFFHSRTKSFEIVDVLHVAYVWFVLGEEHSKLHSAHVWILFNVECVVWWTLKVFHFQWAHISLMIFPSVLKMCDAFHMWIVRHRESLCSIYSIHSQRLQKHTQCQWVHHQLPKWSRTLPFTWQNNNNESQPEHFMF